MPFRHSCFISYRHGPGAHIPRIVEELYQTFTSELGMQMRGLDVFVDRERLQGGEFFDDVIARAVHQSVCMVVAYWPTYFAKDSIYCAREFWAMKLLEDKRLEHVDSRERSKGFIIPIVFRDFTNLPAVISESEHRQAIDFSAVSMYGRTLIRNPRFGPEIGKISKYIRERYEALESTGIDLCPDGVDFKLPAENEVMHLLGRATRHDQAFPGDDPRPGAAL